MFLSIFGAERNVNASGLKISLTLFNAKSIFGNVSIFKESDIDVDVNDLLTEAENVTSAIDELTGKLHVPFSIDGRISGIKLCYICAQKAWEMIFTRKTRVKTLIKLV